jgi:hypothetical protein
LFDLHQKFLLVVFACLYVPIQVFYLFYLFAHKFLGIVNLIFMYFSYSHQMALKFCVGFLSILQLTCDQIDLVADIV